MTCNTLTYFTHFYIDTGGSGLILECLFILKSHLCHCLHAGLSQLVETQQVVIVSLGGDVKFSCRLMEPKDVLQVTWQKETPGGTENVASYNKRFGPEVNPPFNMKVLFLYVGLQNCSVIIRRVSREDESCYKCLFNIYPDGAISGRTCLQVNVTAEISLTLYLCVSLYLLMEPRDVLQVTWQKETQGGTENVASYHKRFGTKVNPTFNRNVEFLNVGLQNCSMFLRGVSREDESCYKCLFTTYHDGSISGRTCLQINELYGPTLQVTPTNDSHLLFSGLTFSCSATGRPAPIVAWNEKPLALENSTTLNITHPNGTVTVTITSTLAVPSLPDNDTMVRCLVHLHLQNLMSILDICFQPFICELYWSHLVIFFYLQSQCL
uniref:Ig-like domain-containing protein n=1 Tax=Esox lucius TaxID=8010 RepID=A0A6Q2ZPC0_ESOLU